MLNFFAKAGDQALRIESEHLEAISDNLLTSLGPQVQMVGAKIVDFKQSR